MRPRAPHHPGQSGSRAGGDQTDLGRAAPRRAHPDRDRDGSDRDEADPDRADLLLSAGRGPQECAWAVAELTARLETEATSRHLSVQRLEAVPGERRGSFRSLLLRITGTGADAFARSWAGTLCWQAPSPFRTSTRRKNWYVSARICEPEPHATAAFDEADVRVVACRTGGPGGQHRNKASTAARVMHRPTGLVVVVDEERYFEANRRLALDLLRRRLAETAAAATRSAAAARRHLHDQLIRGDPARTERPPSTSAETARQSGPAAWSSGSR
ncbi:MAG TPA: peptide chain release factor H [Kineosporiaceae bacterium]|nr:peptide chain release factor H [Kineosporiaceae bacterium]